MKVQFALSSTQPLVSCLACQGSVLKGSSSNGMMANTDLILLSVCPRPCSSHR